MQSVLFTKHHQHKIQNTDKITLLQSQDTCRHEHVRVCVFYWQKNENGKCVIPTSGPNMGAFNNKGDLTPIKEDIPGINENKDAIDFENAGWSASGSSRCAQKKWAIDNSIVWDTVSNYNQC